VAACGLYLHGDNADYGRLDARPDEDGWAFSKQARQAGDPIVSTVAIKGNRMAHINPVSTEIIDLDAETITRYVEATVYGDDV
jgi:hypothetical protein